MSETKTKKTAVPDGVKQPTDRKPKADEASEAAFQFTHDGKTFTSPPLIDILSPGFVRRNRDKEEMDFYFTMVEALFADQPEAIAAIDTMSWDEFNIISESLVEQMRTKVGATPGE